MHLRLSRYHLKLVAFFAANFAGAMVARLLKANPPFFAFFWLPTGLFFGTLMISDRRQWSGIICACVLSSYLFYACGDHYSILLWAIRIVGDITSISIGVWLVQLLGSKPFKLDSVRNAAVLFFVGGLACQCLSATVHAMSISATAAQSVFYKVWLSWYLISVIGFLVLAPVLLFWQEGRFQRSAWGRRRELATGIALLFLGLVAANFKHWLGVVEFGIIVLAVIFWAAIRLGVVGVAVVNIVTVVVAAFFPVQIYSFIGTPVAMTDTQRFAVGPGFILIFIAGYLVALAIEERGRIEKLLAAKNDELVTSLARSDRLALELKNTNAVLQQATNAKTDFVRTVSHEIRNPLGAARMMAEVLLVAPLEDKHKAQLKKLHGCVNYLLAVLDETLDLTQIELGQIPNKLTQFEVGALVGQVMAIFEEVAQRHGIAFKADTGSLDGRFFQGSSMHLQRILINYLSNAFKFTTAGAVVVHAEQVAASLHTVTVRFSVRDTGSGVPPALQPKLFSNYVRSGEPQLDGSARGAGLGLAVCQKLAELNGGRVGFESAVGRGSCFWLELPLIRVEQAEDGPTVFERPDFSAVRTLVVEDEAIQRETMTLLLGEMGVTPAVAGSAAEAEELLGGQAFDLVLSDYNLRTDNGIDLFQRVRVKMPAGTVCPVFHLVTAHLLPSITESALQAGFAAVHRKPLSFSDLYEILMATVAGKAH